MKQEKYICKSFSIFVYGAMERDSKTSKGLSLFFLGEASHTSPYFATRGGRFMRHPTELCVVRQCLFCDMISSQQGFVFFALIAALDAGQPVDKDTACRDLVSLVGTVKIHVACSRELRITRMK